MEKSGASTVNLFFGVLRFEKFCFLSYSNFSENRGTQKQLLAPAARRSDGPASAARPAMAEIGILAVAVDVVQLVKDAAHESSERVRAARNLGALAGEYMLRMVRECKRLCTHILSCAKVHVCVCARARVREPTMPDRVVCCDRVQRSVKRRSPRLMEPSKPVPSTTPTGGNYLRMLAHIEMFAGRGEACQELGASRATNVLTPMLRICVAYRCRLRPPHAHTLQDHPRTHS